jgi:4-hydroxy-tetrahydrodipicolinate synthase
VSEQLQGVLVPIVTPFSEDGESVDETKLRAHVDRLIDAGVDGIVACGSTGESSTLSDDERRHVVEVVVSQADNRVPVIAQTGAMSTRQAVALTRHAEASGARAALVLPPWYVPMPLDRYRAYYAAVAEASDLPLIAYNIPRGTGIDFDPDSFVAMAQDIPSLKYVKESSGNITQVGRYARDYADVVTVLNGIDNLHLPSLSIGAVGSIIGATNVLARENVAITAAFREGRHQDALDLHGRIYALQQFYLYCGHYASGVKATLELVGQSAGPARGPGGPLPEPLQQQLVSIVEQLDFAPAAAAV